MADLAANQTGRTPAAPQRRAVRGGAGVSILAVLVLPVPAGLLSVLIAANMSLAVLVLLVAIHTREPPNLTLFQACCWSPRCSALG